MSIFHQLQNETVGDTPLSTIMRKAKIIAYRLQNIDFKQWIDFELDGYYGHAEKLPDYRSFQTSSFGTFANMAWMHKNAPIPVEALPDDLHELISTVRMFQGIRELEEMIETMNKGNADHLKDLWPASTLQLIQVTGGYQCLSAWRIIPKTRISQILDTIKTRLLTFSLELGEKYPIAVAQDFTIPQENPPSDQVMYAFYTYIMNSTSITQGATMNTFNQNVQNQHVNYQYNAAGDINFSEVQNQVALATELEKLLEELGRASQAGIIDQDVHTDTEYQLKKAINEAKKPEPNRETLLQRIKDATTLLGGIAAASDLVKGFGEAAEVIGKLLP